jgi:hypothetical protein
MSSPPSEISRTKSSILAAVTAEAFAEDIASLLDPPSSLPFETLVRRSSGCCISCFGITIVFSSWLFFNFKIKNRLRERELPAPLWIAVETSEISSLAVTSKFLLLLLNNVDQGRQAQHLPSCDLSELEGSHNQGTVGVPVCAAMRSSEGPERTACCGKIAGKFRIGERSPEKVPKPSHLKISQALRGTDGSVYRQRHPLETQFH